MANNFKEIKQHTNFPGKHQIIQIDIYSNTHGLGTNLSLRSIVGLSQ